MQSCTAVKQEEYSREATERQAYYCCFTAVQLYCSFTAALLLLDCCPMRSAAVWQAGAGAWING
jgi:hypothetical protein